MSGGRSHARRKSPGSAPASEAARVAALHDGDRSWRFFGPYLSERQWGTVREDYSEDGSSWTYFPYDHARSRAYRWGEDGIFGISDEDQRLCFGLALWNGEDSHLKERLFGLSGPEGNHGEDVKELYHHLDNVPSHAWMAGLYRYPHASFPYERLREENARRGKHEREYELVDTGVFQEGRFFDVHVETAKAGPRDLLIRIRVRNHGPEPRALEVLPKLWFRNTWSWEPGSHKPRLLADGPGAIAVEHRDLPPLWLFAEAGAEALFCENETNVPRIFGGPAITPFPKDGINDHIVHGAATVNPDGHGTIAVFRHRLQVPAGEEVAIRLRLGDRRPARPFADFDAVVAARAAEADAFYAHVHRGIAGEDRRRVSRQALSGLLWSKQWYHIDIPRWLQGDPAQPPPPAERLRGRNREWTHLNNADVVLMPDPWEYPWYASWDLAFHCVALAMIDPGFAKDQLVLFTREWYLHPNGQMPAYEWALGDVNPPVHAWAAWRTYKIDAKVRNGPPDRAFLERVFHKLLLNFTWWVNRKDAEGRNVFQGGFLGLDNIGVFDRSAPLPTGGHLEQSDATSWMASYALTMMRIALELAQQNPVYEDLATKFFEHFLYIAGAMANVGGEDVSLWDEEDEFFYDVLHVPGRPAVPLRVRSLVGLLPMLAVETLEPELLDRVPDFKKRLEWFLAYRPDLAGLISRWAVPGSGERRLLSLLRGHRLKCLLRRMLDESEFLSPFGIRSVSKVHGERPYEFRVNGTAFTVSYQPGESESGLFGGNSNWRGPIWMPLNFLLVEALQRFHHYYGDEFRVECPHGSGVFLSLSEVAAELSERLCRLFLRDDRGRRPIFGDQDLLQHDRRFSDHLIFPEYFHGEDGRGLGACHQTGWTALVAKLLQPRAQPRASKEGGPARPGDRPDTVPAR
jgi:hypothetical protein